MKSKKLSITTLLGQLLSDPDRKPVWKIFFELCYLSLLYRNNPLHYFSRYLFKRDQTNIADYLPSKFLYKIKAKFNEQEIRCVLDHKLYFDFYYHRLHVSIPKLWMYNYRKTFIIGNEEIVVNDLTKFKFVLETVIRNNSSDGTVFIKKAYGSYHGANIYKVHLNQLSGQSDEINHLYLEIIKSGFLFQESIKQHSVLGKLNPSCVNTMRLDTFIDGNGVVEIISGYLKTNMKDHYVDNEPTAGCEISIDLETGKLRKYGHVTLKFNGLIRPTQHPITRTLFENLQIPYFREAKNLVIRAASAMPCLRLIGWDVAIGEDGPILIEGNSDYDIAASDLAYGGYRANPIFQKVLKEFKSQ